MKRKLIIDGNAVYELDEECMLEKEIKEKQEKKEEYKEINRVRESGKM